MTRATTLFLFAASIALSGCAEFHVTVGAHATVRAYRPYITNPGLQRQVLFEAAARFAIEEYGDDLRMSADRQSFLAFTPERGGARDRIRIEVTAEGRLTIEVRTQLRDARGSWGTEGRVVCATYRHARERAIAARVIDAAGYPERTQPLYADCAECRAH